MLRFSIRDLLWVVALSGVGVSWQIDRTKLDDRRKIAVIMCEMNVNPVFETEKAQAS